MLLASYTRIVILTSECPCYESTTYMLTPCSYRKVVIKMFWDYNKNPSVLAPIGDFFCIGEYATNLKRSIIMRAGNSMPGNFESLPFTVSAKPSEHQTFGGSCGANCYLRMPFNQRARIEIVNEGENAYMQVGEKLDPDGPVY